MALAHAAKEGLWLRALLKYLGLSQQTTPIYCDNTAAITVSKDPANHARVKHIDMRYHFIRGVIETGQIQVSFIEGANQIADGFTKSLPKPLF